MSALPGRVHGSRQRAIEIHFRPYYGVSIARPALAAGGVVAGMAGDEAYLNIEAPNRVILSEAKDLGHK
ncbi:MAG: hypothetical protein AB7R89_12725 [Dehalococcoidia bacterium]